MGEINPDFSEFFHRNYRRPAIMGTSMHKNQSELSQLTVVREKLLPDSENHNALREQLSAKLNVVLDVICFSR
jgi:hypothetical protein